MHVCMYACMHVCMYACMHVCMHACMHAWCMHACMYVCMYVYHVCMFDACMYVCMYVCMYIYIYSSPPTTYLSSKFSSIYGVFLTFWTPKFKALFAYSYSGWYFKVQKQSKTYLALVKHAWFSSRCNVCFKLKKCFLSSSNSTLRHNQNDQHMASSEWMNWILLVCHIISNKVQFHHCAVQFHQDNHANPKNKTIKSKLKFPMPFREK